MGISNALRNAFVTLFGFCALSFGATTSVRIVASGGSPIPVANTVGDPQSEVLVGVGNNKHIKIINATADTIAVFANAPDKDLAPTPDVEDIYLPPATAVVLDDHAAGPRVYLRADDGSPITTGEVIIKVY